MNELPRATKTQVWGRNNGKKQVYQRWQIEGHEGFFHFRLQTGRDQEPCPGDIHAKYATRAGDRTASFCLDHVGVPNN